MEIFIPVYLAIFGAIIGSFLNVVILRFNTGWGIKGRSQCFSCAKKLEWFELLPIVSYLTLRGKCRSCSSAISVQYPLVEAVTALVFVALYYVIGPVDVVSLSYYALHCIAAAILIVICVYDLRHKIIPDPLAYPLMILSFVILFFRGIALPDLLAGPLFFCAFGVIWLMSGGRWMGFGDAKLVVSLGWLVGLVAGISGIMLAFWIGAVVSILYLVVVKKKHTIRGIEVPFAPYLILGVYIAWFLQLDFLYLNELFF